MKNMQLTPAINGAKVVSGMPVSWINPNKARPIPTHTGSNTIAVKNLTLLDTFLINQNCTLESS